MKYIFKTIFFLSLTLFLTHCRTAPKPSEEDQKKKIIMQSNLVKFKFDHEVLSVLEHFQVDLNKLILRAFAPNFKKMMQTRFGGPEEKLSQHAFYKTLKKYFPESVLSRVQYRRVDKFPNFETLLAEAGMNKSQLADFNVKVDEKIWNMQVAAMTIGDLIYIEKDSVDKIETFFHECVHVMQYDKLGLEGFLSLYADSILAGMPYEEIPLEMTAFYLEDLFVENKGKNIFDAYAFVRKVH